MTIPISISNNVFFDKQILLGTDINAIDLFSSNKTGSIGLDSIGYPFKATTPPA